MKFRKICIRSINVIAFFLIKLFKENSSCSIEKVIKYSVWAYYLHMFEFDASRR